MAWSVEFERKAKREINRLDPPVAKRIFSFLERLAVADEPRKQGASLRGPLGNYWKYRVGDYRIIAEIDRGKSVVTILRVAHRANVYVRRLA